MTTDDDIDLITQAALWAILVIATGAVLFIIIPALVNLHADWAMLLATALGIATPLGSFVAGRMIWRTFNIGD